SASASTDDTHVDVVFTEDNGLDPGTAGDFNNYAIWDGGACGAGSQLAVTAAVQVGNTVTLTTATQTPELAYRVCASNIDDVPGNTLGLGFADFTGFILTDETAPNAVIDLVVDTQYARGLMLKWTEPCDDGVASCPNTVNQYDVRYVHADYYPTDLDTQGEFEGIWPTTNEAALEPTPVTGDAQIFFNLGCKKGVDNSTCATDDEKSLWPNTLYYIDRSDRRSTVQQHCKPHGDEVRI
ncbi:MAG: hypothetical protein ACYSTI_14575, partial [Planctomycetota bacterium]